MAIDLRSLGNAVRRGLRMLQNRAAAPPPPGTGRDRRPGAKRTAPGGGIPAGPAAYPGDYRGRAAVRYAPQPDGDPDPGEVVWAWVPYEEDHGQGKDRPVLLVGHNGPFLLGLMLTSRDRVPAGSASGEYVDLGSGGWDKQGRASEVRLDRILQLRPDSIRREGAVLDKARFETVAAGLRRRHGWT
ncbi:type II toxin-antitoxin system PemK/MazF family toxin [Arthrobacter sp. B1I2]|uniref:type II toxin-antitoxin system PemK/MazF family toxin n=1 Tax=Arthrobacter sp. B1I2 TaxID=3042263 RepID=UPI0027865F8B|nr:type II toxin-antitoxin system PemK/MazF family toxin [Arthrobacter sp. B1I2]MDQ0732108.1 hypothetical protein [Arthrobacter sp. B1I2]